MTLIASFEKHILNCRNGTVRAAEPGTLDAEDQDKSVSTNPICFSIKIFAAWIKSVVFA